MLQEMILLIYNYSSIQFKPQLHKHISYVSISFSQYQNSYKGITMYLRRVSKRKEWYLRFLPCFKVNISPYIEKIWSKKEKDFGLKSLPNWLANDANRLWPRFLENNMSDSELNRIRGFLLDYKVGFFHNLLDKCSNQLESKFSLPNWINTFLNRLVIDQNHF